MATWCQRDDRKLEFSEKDKKDLKFLYEEWTHPMFISIEKYKELIEGEGGGGSWRTSRPQIHSVHKELIEGEGGGGHGERRDRRLERADHCELAAQRLGGSVRPKGLHLQASAVLQVFEGRLLLGEDAPGVR